VIASDQDDRRTGQCLPEPLELAKGKDNRRVGRADGVEEITGDDDRVGPGLDDTVDGCPKGLRDVRLALVDAGGRQPMELPDAEMGVGDMCQFRPGNVS